MHTRTHLQSAESEEELQASIDKLLSEYSALPEETSVTSRRNIQLNIGLSLERLGNHQRALAHYREVKPLYRESVWRKREGIAVPLGQITFSSLRQQNSVCLA